MNKHDIEQTLRRALTITMLLSSTSLAVSLPIVRQFPAPGEASEGMAFVGDDLWVWDIDVPNMFYVLDPMRGEVRGTHTSPHSEGISALTFDGTSLWGATNTPSPALMAQLNPTDGSVISYYEPPVTEPTGIAFDGQYLWIAETGTYRIVQVDPADMSIRRTIMRESWLSYNIAWDGFALWMGAYEWLPDGTSRHWIYQIDSVTGATLGKYDPPGLSAIGMTYNDGYLYVSDLLTETIYVLSIPEPSTALLFLTPALGLLRSRRHPVSS